MKNPLNRWLAAIVLFLSSNANAAVVEINVVLDLYSGSLGSVPDGGGTTVQAWFDNGISIDPVAVQTGDQILLNVDFAAGQALQMSDAGGGTQRLSATYIGPANSGPWSYSTTLTRLDGIDGTIDLPLTHNNSVFLLEPLGGPVADFTGALTDSSLAFTGFSTLTTYTSGFASVDFGALGFLFTADEIAIVPVPIPGALWLFGVALAGLLPLRRGAQ